MTDPDQPPDSDPPLCGVGEYDDEAAAHEHALVILAMGHACWISHEPGSGRFLLDTDEECAAAVATELDIYDCEQAEFTKHPKIEISGLQHDAGWNAYALWAAALIITFTLQPSRHWLLELGASSSIGLIDHHEYWRPFTSLFLHADLSHLAGNLLSGLIFATLVSKSVGPWRGWLMILASGTVGNALTSLLTYPEPFTSIGASTAVFGALGILSGTGCMLMLRFRLRLPWLRIIAPLIGGIVVLGMVGSGQPGGNTDVLGHVFGFAAGVLLGLSHSATQSPVRNTSSS